MAFSLLPGDFRKELLTETHYTNKKCSEYDCGHYMKREEISLKNFDQNYIKRQIINHLSAYGYELPPVGWYVEDNVPGTKIFMIKANLQVTVKDIGFIPFFEKEVPTEPWNGIIIDLDDPDFIIKPSPINNYPRMIAKTPLLDGQGAIVVDAIHLYEDGSRDEKIEFFNNSIITPYSEGIIMRLWKHKDHIYCSSMNRIDAWNLALIQDLDKTAKYFWEKISYLKPEEFFTNEDRLCFHLQLNAPEILPYTHVDQYHLTLVGVLPSRRDMDPNQCVVHPMNLVTPASIPIPLANTWLGFDVIADRRLNNGNAVIVVEPSSGHAVIVMSHAYAWRSSLIGDIALRTPWPKRYLEICDSRMLKEDDYLSIYPQVVADVTTPSGRLENTSKIWAIISPPYLRQDAEEALEKYWGKEGVIYQLSQVMSQVWFDPQRAETKKKLAEKDAHYMKDIIDRFAKTFKHIPNDKLFVKLLFNSDPSKPHFSGSFIYTLIRRMVKEENTRKAYEKKLNAMRSLS